MSTVALYSEMKKSFSVNKQGCIKEAIQGNMLCETTMSFFCFI